MMNIEKIINELDLDVFSGIDKLNKPVTGAYASDLLSDVMGNAGRGDVWVTMQTHGNIVAVATLKELAAIIVVNGGQPDDKALDKANSEGIVILGAKQGSFHVCGRLYKILDQNAMV